MIISPGLSPLALRARFEPVSANEPVAATPRVRFRLAVGAPLAGPSISLAQELPVGEGAVNNGEAKLTLSTGVAARESPELKAASHELLMPSGVSVSEPSRHGARGVDATDNGDAHVDKTGGDGGEVWNRGSMGSPVRLERTHDEAVMARPAAQPARDWLQGLSFSAAVTRTSNNT